MSENDLMSQMESLPLSLRYGVRQLQTRINRNTNLLPVGKDDVSGNGAGTVRFRFPSASIINLSSISISFNSTISGLDTGTNWINALVPAAYKYVKRAQFFLGGVACCGSLCQEYNQVYHAMLKATTNLQYCHAKTLNGFTEVSDLYDKFGELANVPASSTKTCFQVLDDFLLLARGNGASVNPDMFIDTSLWNDLELELLFDNNAILSVFTNSAGKPSTWANDAAAGVSWALSNIRLNVDCISSIPAVYGAVMELRTSRPEPIRLVFQNIVSQVAVVQGTNRIQVSSTSIDGLMICGLVSDYNTPKAFVANLSANTEQNINITNNPKFNFVSLGLNENSVFSGVLQVGTTTYPTTAYNNVFLLADSTFRHYWHNSIVATSLLYQKVNVNVDASNIIVQESDPYIINNFLSNQFIWVQSFCLEDGWSSASKTLSGIDTQSTNTDILIILNITTNAYSLLMIGLLSSYLEYDTQSRRVRVIQ